jgi:hydroxyacylglutathione hydrolase
MRRGMKVRQVKVGPMENFSYLVVDEGSREALVVDSGWETAPLVREVAVMGAKVRFAVATHGHFDHTATLDELVAETGGEVVAHADSPIECDLRVGDGDELRLGGKKVTVLHTPGHTQDSICLYDGVEVFTGDTIFVGTIGRFDHDMAATIHRSIWEVIMKLPGATVMYPGHDYGDYPSRTLREEAMSNPYLSARDVRTFLSLFS